MKLQTDQDGWDIIDIEDNRTLQQLPSQLRYHHKDAPRDILDSHSHSLQPDMAMGWKPKLPSCPLPLSYNNVYVDTLTAHLANDDRFKLSYLGPRYTNSVQLNQQYNYSWRYRSRYNTSIKAVKQAVKRVGEGSRRVALDLSNNQISFDSAFQSGNLDMAVRIKKNQYDLFLRCDTNTRGHTAWFYFKVSNKDQIGEIQFNICNFGKRKNLYAQGMKPYTCVDDQWNQDRCYDVNWVERICRYGFQKKTFQLQFKYNFKEKNQSVQFAYALPYTYSRLQNLITQICTKDNKYLRTSKLCQTLGGLDVPLLTITNSIQGEQNNSEQNLSSAQVNRKKIVLITGRIHPGQTHSSFIIQGLIKYLLSQQPTAHMLRASFVFHIIPMLNPDGVVAGNFRTSYSGKDLNRQFNKLNKYVLPQITALHDLALKLKHNHRSCFQFYLDFHAHSSKRGLFCYGPEHLPGKNQFFKCRAFAKLIQQKSSIFSYRKSIFAISQHKKTTSRAHMLWKIKIPMSFTFEVSNGLYQTKQNKNKPFSQKILLQLGTALMQGLFRYGQLQMRLPNMKIRAKVDTGIQKRNGLSAKQFRKSSSKKGRTLTIKNMNYLRDLSNTQSCRADKFNKEVSLNDILEKQVTKKSSLSKQEKQDFQSLIEEIQKEEQEEKVMQDYEGGSDSESEADDLEQKDLAKLHKIIETRYQNSRVYTKGTLQWRSHYKKQVFRRQSQSEQAKQINTSHQLQCPKKQITSKYLMPLKYSALPPKAKKVILIQPEKVVLPPKNFALQI